MSDATIIYCGFMYLLTLGIVGAGLCNKNNRKDLAMLFGMAMHFMTAPVSTPIILGILIYDCTKQHY